MRGIVWTSLISMLLVVAVVIVFIQLGSFAFGQGNNVFSGMFEWFEDKTGIDVPGGEGVYSIAFLKNGANMRFIVDLAAVRDKPIEIRVNVGGSQYDLIEVAPEDDSSVDGNVVLSNIPASTVEVLVLEVDDNQNYQLLKSEDKLVVNLQYFETASPDTYALRLINELCPEDSSGCQDRFIRTFNALSDYCGIESTCGGSSPAGYPVAHAFSAGSEASSHCSDDPEGSECRFYRAKVIGWLYCADNLNRDPATIEDTAIPNKDAWVEQMLGTRIEQSACTPSEADEGAAQCWTPQNGPRVRSISCTEELVWR